MALPPFSDGNGDYLMSAAGRHGRAELHFARRGQRTILYHQYATVPAQIIRPFYTPDDERAYVFLLTPTGGMLGGDRLDIHIVLEPDAKVCLTTASATKVHPSADLPAEQSLRIDLGAGSSLEYLPEPTILFERHGGDSARSCIGIPIAACCSTRVGALDAWLDRRFSRSPPWTPRLKCIPLIASQSSIGCTSAPPAILTSNLAYGWLGHT